MNALVANRACILYCFYLLLIFITISHRDWIPNAICNPENDSNNQYDYLNCKQTFSVNLVCLGLFVCRFQREKSLMFFETTFDWNPLFAEAAQSNHSSS